MLPQVTIVGAGRVGLTLVRALRLSGRNALAIGRLGDLDRAVGASELIILAVPDDTLGEVAQAIARTSRLTANHTVLHCSGLHDHTVLAPLVDSGAALGSFHPLQTFTNPEGEPEALTGAPAILEGDPRAVATAQMLAETLGMAPVVVLEARKKAEYHAAAVFASNYLVVLASMASRLARDAGVGDAADHLFLPLMRRTLDHVAEGDAVSALTGPIRRGDAGTVARHLAVLDGAAREIYVALGREALRLAEEAGLDRLAVLRVRELLE